MKKITDTGESRELTLWDFILVGLKQEEIRGAIVVGWRVGVVVHILWVCGWMAAVGFEAPFAKADTEKQVLAMRVENLKSRVFDLRIKQCEAVKKGTGAQVYTMEIDKQAELYRRLTNNDLKLPDCSEIQ